MKVEEAERLGAEFDEYLGRWSWRFGQRSSADQYCALFETPEACAEHFLMSREAKNAREADARRAKR